jgi:hypothetical protein
MSDSAQIAQLTVRRMTKYPDRLRAYKVRLDGEVLGSLLGSESVTLPLAPGRHLLVMAIDWCSSELILFEVKSGEHAVFECGSQLTGWRLLFSPFWVFFRPRQYLWLRRAT